MGAARPATRPGHDGKSIGGAPRRSTRARSALAPPPGEVAEENRYNGGTRMSEPFAAKYIRNIDANRAIKDELTTAIPGQSAPRGISVTGLVNPRPALLRWTQPG